MTMETPLYSSCHGSLFSIAALVGGSGALNSIADGTLLGGSVGGAVLSHVVAGWLWRFLMFN